MTKGQKVILLRDITRREGLYARAGETGIVHELFIRLDCLPRLRKKSVYVKVIMNLTGKLKTFRKTSLKVIK